MKNINILIQELEFLIEDDGSEFYSQGPSKVLPKLIDMKKASKSIEGFSGKNGLSDEEIDSAIEYVSKIKKGSVGIMNYQGRTLDPEGPAYSGKKSKKKSLKKAL